MSNLIHVNKEYQQWILPKNQAVTNRPQVVEESQIGNRPQLVDKSRMANRPQLEDDLYEQISTRLLHALIHYEKSPEHT